MATKQSDTKLEGKLVKSLEGAELGSLAKEYIELGLDSLLKEGIVKDIPIVNTLVAVFKVGVNIRDRTFLNKLLCFLTHTGDTTQEARQEFLSKYCKDSRRFEDTIFLIVEKADRMEKSTLIGKIFKACILDKISYENALRLSDMVNRAFWQDLEDMFKSYSGFPGSTGERLFSAGLCRSGTRNNYYPSNDYAATLRQIHEERFNDIQPLY